MAEEHSTAEAHLIGSLIESLSNAGEDEVFFTGNTTNSSMPQVDSSSDSRATNISAVPPIPAVAMSPHLFPFQVLQQLHQPNQSFWAPAPNSTVQLRGRPPYPVQLPSGAANLGQGHGRWIPPPQNVYSQATPPFSPAELQQRQQQYQAYLAYQQQMYEMAAVRPPLAPVLSGLPTEFASTQQHRNYQGKERSGTGDQQQQYGASTQAVLSQNLQQPQPHEQWESIYTPFGPVRSAGNFSVSGADSSQAERKDSLSEYELKKRSASVSTPSHGVSTTATKSSANEISISSSSSSGPATATSSTTASSPSLPPKGRSYRDVAKTKTETKSGNSRTKKTAFDAGNRENQGVPLKRNDGEQSATEILSSRPPTGDRKGKSSGMPCRKFSAPARESSSDSISEFGGSENGTSSAPPVIGERYGVVENYVAGFLDKRIDDDSGETKQKDEDESKLTDRNVLKKNATTATPSGDFQKIMRRKGSQTKLGAVQGRDTSPVMAAASRYAVLGKKSQSTATKQDSTALSEAASLISHSIGAQDYRQQQQRIKLNNEQTSPRFNSKSPTRKAAYINNDLTWPSKTKSTNRMNENGDWMDNDDDAENEANVRSSVDSGRNSTSRGNLADDDADLEVDEIDESDEDGDDEETYDDGRHSSKRKEEFGDGSIRNRKKGNGLGGSSSQKFGIKKGKAKRGDSGELAKKRRQQRGVVMRWINFVLTAIACYVRDAAVWLVNLVTDIGHQLWEIAVYCTKSCCIKISTSAQCAWYSTGERIRKFILCIRQKEWSILLWWRSRRNRGGESDRLGLEENIDLPNTGEEALKRLLSCRGQDAYSILGLRPDCTDDEVKCYYRRQAILVHPDKNACYGSDEAFKILAAAFELIGTSERRRNYDLQNLHRTKAMQELQEMLNKLKEKMEEIRSTMQCDCGGKHKRFPTDRELAYARFCRKCGEKHHAREGDIWAESHWFGFLWYYYACMDGVVYDITEWAGCQKNNLKHMKPDTHLVQYRLITGRNARQFHHQQQTTSAYGQQQQYGSSQQYSRQPSDGASPNLSNTAAEELLNRYWEERLASSSSKNVSTAATSMYLPAGGSPSSSTAFNGLGSVDFSTPTQSKFNPPACSSHGDSRPRKAGRRRKPRT